MGNFPVEPPRGAVMPAGLQAMTLEVGAAIVALLTIAALWRLIRRRDPLLLFCLLGGAGMNLLEPICNVLGLAYHPEIGQIAAYRAMDRDIPWHVAMIYPCFFAVYSWLFFRFQERRIGRKKFWLFCGLAAAISFVFEISPVRDGLWIYYGAQPLRLWNMPLWWYAANSVAMIGGATFAVMGVTGLKGWRRWPIVLLIPVGGVGFHTGVGAPVEIAINSGLPAATDPAPALLTFAFALAVAWACGRMLFPDAVGRTAARGAP